jgi:uncharacterized membrane protein
MELMMKRTTEVKLAAAAVLVAISTASSASAPYQTHNTKEKCYGIAMGGQNDCRDAISAHSCAGLAKADKLATEWRYVATGTCTQAGGTTAPPATK